MKKPTPVKMWAPIVKTQRIEFISGRSIRITRQAAKAAYLSLFEDEYHKEILKRVRFARVTVTVDQ